MAGPMNYTVEKKEEIRQIDEDFKPFKLYRITARSKGGTRFSVEVRDDQLTKAPEILSKKATELDSI